MKASGLNEKIHPSLTLSKYFHIVPTMNTDVHSVVRQQTIVPHKLAFFNIQKSNLQQNGTAKHKFLLRRGKYQETPLSSQNPDRNLSQLPH